MLQCVSVDIFCSFDFYTLVYRKRIAKVVLIFNNKILKYIMQNKLFYK